LGKTRPEGASRNSGYSLRSSTLSYIFLPTGFPLSREVPAHLLRVPLCASCHLDIASEQTLEIPTKLAFRNFILEQGDDLRWKVTKYGSVLAHCFKNQFSCELVPLGPNRGALFGSTDGYFGSSVHQIVSWSRILANKGPMLYRNFRKSCNNIPNIKKAMFNGYLHPQKEQ
jgi:hypothetical protein